ncbi:hypothetical protein DFP75_109137 [Marinomonas alcarazii]|uniref:Uncharacterized protein n=1 Tax=Marinomonas alcarazii TaxID=491949 RepID=A0A318UVV4_9GAMM|nr:hypothetical protein [Marinomonas alcarazii]PYF79298.1 hypothetical protein DFP75_109137 [Marinomonas alcarazii]
MQIWHWALVASSVVLLIVLLFVAHRYLALKKALAGSDEALSGSAHPLGEDFVSADKKAQWLALLKQQRNICKDLLEKSPKVDSQGRSALSCWAIFLDVEMHVIERSVPNEKIVMLLGVFKGLLDRVDQAQEIDALLKSLKVNQSLLYELNKVIQKAGDKVFAQDNITADLNNQLTKLQAELSVESDLDDALAALRAEMASMHEFSERLAVHMEELKDIEEHEAYVAALEGFINDVSEAVFLDPMKTELDDKVADLKALAAYQKNIIEELKEGVHKVKTDNEGEGKYLSAYDVSIVRLEKSLLESGRVVKSLEAKLLSLQTIQYNLNIDAAKRDEALKKATALLSQKKQSSSGAMDIYGVMEEERSTMKNIEDLLYQGSFTEQSDAYVSEQSMKLNSLRQMVDESELYVEMLERDLEDARVLHETLMNRKLYPEDYIDSAHGDEDLLNNQDLEEIENLQEINNELEEEKRRLEAEIYDGQELSDEAVKLQKKITELDAKIEAIQEKYVEMEERYLAALMAKEHKL